MTLTTGRRPLWPRRELPMWGSASAAAVALVLGLWAGFQLGGDDDAAESRTPIFGTVNSTDTESGTLCLADRDGVVECYVAPGLGLRPGQQIRYLLEQVPVDPQDPGKATRNHIVWVGPAQ